MIDISGFLVHLICFMYYVNYVFLSRTIHSKLLLESDVHITLVPKKAILAKENVHNGSLMAVFLSVCSTLLLVN